MSNKESAAPSQPSAENQGEAPAAVITSEEFGWRLKVALPRLRLVRAELTTGPAPLGRLTGAAALLRLQDLETEKDRALWLYLTELAKAAAKKSEPVGDDFEAGFIELERIVRKERDDRARAAHDPRPEPPPHGMNGSAGVHQLPRQPGEDREEEQDQSLPEPEWATTWAKRDYPRPEWLVDLLIPRHTQGAIVAPSHTGKTAFAIRCVYEALAAGHKVAYIMEESTAFDFRARLMAVGLTEEMQTRLLIFFQLGARLDDPDWVAHLQVLLIENNIDICFVDTWSDVIQLDQLNQREVLPALEDLKRTRIRTNCTMAVLMHTAVAPMKPDSSGVGLSTTEFPR